MLVQLFLEEFEADQPEAATFQNNSRRRTIGRLNDYH
jgi:hypothetical protein